MTRDKGKHGVAEEMLRFPMIETKRPATASYPKIDDHTSKTFIYVNNFEKRDYQLDIAQAAVSANTLVVIPTGLGKTFIAAMVLLNFHRWFPTGKLIFVAHTKPLVTQQMQSVIKTTQVPKDEFVEITGSVSPDSRRHLWQNGRIFFATPDCITNDITNGICPVSKIVLVVVDEAHKAHGDHSYCQLIKEIAAVTGFFRVMALTATPGKTYDDIQQVIYNLMIEQIECRSESDCEQYSHMRETEKIVVPDAPEVEQLSYRLNAILEVYLEDLYRQNMIAHTNPSRTTKGMLVKLLKTPLSETTRNNVEQAMKLIVLREKLVWYGIRVFKRELSDHLHNAVRDAHSQKLVDLLDTANHIPPNDPKLDKLYELVKEFIESSTDSKVIVFCSYRTVVEDIVERLNNPPSVVKCVSFIGQSSSKTSKGCNQREQLRRVEGFKKGSYNVFVSTSIGEEGLDIGEVDLIICYDVPKSPIRLIQRTGRTGRHRDGRVMYLVTQSTQKSLINVENGHDAISNMIRRYSNDFKFFRNEKMKIGKFQVVCKQFNYDKPIPTEQHVKPESKRATLFGYELADLHSELCYRRLSLNEHMKYQTMTVSFTDTSFSAESVILGKIVSSIAEREQLSLMRTTDTVFALDPDRSSSPSNVSLSMPSTPRLSALPSISDGSSPTSSRRSSQKRSSLNVAALLNIESISSSDSQDGDLLSLRHLHDSDNAGAERMDGASDGEVRESSNTEKILRNFTDSQRKDTSVVNVEEFSDPSCCSETSSFVSESSDSADDGSDDYEPSDSDTSRSSLKPEPVDNLSIGEILGVTVPMKPKVEAASDFDFSDSSQSSEC